MALTLETINKGRQAIGLPPLDKLPGETTDTTNKEVKPELNEDGTPKIVSKDNPELNEDGTPKIIKTAEPAELTDEQLLELLNKRNISVKSLDELKKKDPEKTPEQIAEEKEAQKLSYALTKGLFNKKEYESFITDSNSKESVVYNQYYTESKAEDPTLTDEEIQAEFKEKFGLDAEPGSRRHKRGAKEMEVIAKELLTSKYGKIYEADKKFSAYEQELAETEKYNQNILSKAPQYKKNVDEAFTALKVINDVELPDEAIKEIKDRFLSKEFVENQINSEVTKEQLMNQVRAAIVTKNFDFIVEKKVEKALLDKAAGVRGIVPPADKKKETKPVKELTPEQQKMLAIYQQNQPQKAEQN